MAYEHPFLTLRRDSNLKIQKALPYPFAQDEVELILEELRRRNGQAMADYFAFSFHVGLRAGEQIAMRWEDVDLRIQTVLVRRAKVINNGTTEKPYADEQRQRAA